MSGQCVHVLTFVPVPCTFSKGNVLHLTSIGIIQSTNIKQSGTICHSIREKLNLSLDSKRNKDNAICHSTPENWTLAPLCLIAQIIIVISCSASYGWVDSWALMHFAHVAFTLNMAQLCVDIGIFPCSNWMQQVRMADLNVVSTTLCVCVYETAINENTNRPNKYILFMSTKQALTHPSNIFPTHPNRRLNSITNL